MPSPRLSARALIVQEGRLLLVNAYPGGVSDLWCAPGGGVERGASVVDNLAREVAEETGLRIAVGALAGVSEFHNPDNGFHQVDLFFHARLLGGALDRDWRDPAGVVSERAFFTPAELARIRFKPDMLARLAFAPEAPAYHGIEPMAP